MIMLIVYLKRAIMYSYLKREVSPNMSAYIYFEFITTFNARTAVKVFILKYDEK